MPFLSITWVSLQNTYRSIIQPSQAAFPCSKSTMEHWNNVWNLFKVNNKDFEYILQLAPVFLYLTKMWDFVKIFNSLNPLKPTEIWQNLYQFVN